MIIQKILGYNIYNETQGNNRYYRVCDLLMQTVDPDTLFRNILDCKHQDVFTSPRLRAIRCLKESSIKSVTVLPELNEITFQLSKFCDEQTFLENGSAAVRLAFVEAFIANKLGTSHAQLQKELDFLVELSRQANPPLCISHTFRMKLIEIYSRVGNELFKNPTIIKQHLDSKNHIYTFGEVIEI